MAASPRRARRCCSPRSPPGRPTAPSLAARVSAAADELEASAELLALLDRAAEAGSVDRGRPRPGRARGGAAVGTARGRRVLRVRFDEASPDSLVTADPYVLGPLLSLVVACVHQAPASSRGRARPAAPEAGFIVEAATPADDALPTLAVRVMPWVPPTETTARAVGGEVRCDARAPGRVPRSIRLKRLSVDGRAGASIASGSDEPRRTLRPRVEAAFADRKLLADPDHRFAVEGTLAALDRGELRVASPPDKEGGEWTTHAWVKEAILLYFALRKIETIRRRARSSTTTRSPSSTTSTRRRARRAAGRGPLRLVPRARRHPDARRTSTSGRASARARWSTPGPPSARARRSGATATSPGASASAACSSLRARRRSSSRTGSSSARAPSSSRACASGARRSSAPASCSRRRRPSST